MRGKVVSGTSRARKTKEGNAVAVAPPFEWEGFRRPTIGRLDTPGRIRREIVRLYRDARLGELDVGNASKLANILFLALRALESEAGPRELPRIVVCLEDPGEGFHLPGRDCPPESPAGT
jgi:hypothetical protein